MDEEKTDQEIKAQNDEEIKDPIAEVKNEDPEEVVEVEVAVAEEKEEADPKAELEAEPEAAAPAHKPETLDEVIEAAKALLALEGADIAREAVTALRGQFVSIRKPQQEEAFKLYLDEGGDADAYVEVENDQDVAFKAVMDQIKEKKAAYTAQLEAKRLENLERKNAIIAEIKALADDTDNVNRTFPRYRELQDEFNNLGEVPPTDETAVWKRFQEAREQFSDNLKINKELRDYDFKKNLELKEMIIAEAAKLNDEKDIITAKRRLDQLYDKWREIGPVAKEQRDEVWARFKEAQLGVNKRYQEHFEERKAREAESEVAKTALCERIEALDFDLKSFNAWEQMTTTIKEAQDEWRKLGFASRKMNTALYNRFRARCDVFFAAKASYFKEVSERLKANLAAKTALVEKAEALKDNTDWRATTDELVNLQKEWKTIGPVAKKHSDAIWKRFQDACDYFFEQKKANTSGARQTELANLQAKRDLIKELDKITAEMGEAEANALIDDIFDRWRAIGHVPFREKERVYDALLARIAEVREQFGFSAPRGSAAPRGERRQGSSRRGNAGAPAAPQSDADRDRDRQLRLLETRRAELRTYENNLGFLNAKSKSGNSMVQEFERKIERLRADIAELEAKIK